MLPTRLTERAAEEQSPPIQNKIQPTFHKCNLQPSSRHTEFPTVFGATKGFKAPVVTKWQQVVTLTDTITISPLDGRGLSRIKNMMIAVTLDVLA